MIIYPNGSMFTGVVEGTEVRGVSLVELGSDGMRLWKSGEKAVAYLPKNGSLLELDLKEREVGKCYQTGSKAA